MRQTDHQKHWGMLSGSQSFAIRSADFKPHIKLHTRYALFIAYPCALAQQENRKLLQVSFYTSLGL